MIINNHLSKTKFSMAIMFFIGFTFFVLANCKGQNPSAVKPNIILIMADDLGYGGIGSYGEHRIKTPHLDALTREGIKFTDFHSNGAVCTPTRAALLTGNYQQKSGLEGVIYAYNETRKTGLDTSQITIAKLLKNNGYRTGIMGKWHLGYQKEYNPVYHGFDEFHGYVSGNIDYHSHIDGSGVYDWWHDLEIVEEEGYVTDLITQHSVNFIHENRDNPFFLYVAQESPHNPFQGRNDPALRSLGTGKYTPVQDKRRAYKEMVEVMDEGMGKIMGALEKNNLLENTLVFFLSDNGALPIGNNGGLNGKKALLLEGGHRVPAIAYWKGHISPGESPETLITMDLLPTFLSVSRSQVPQDVKFDGRDFSKILFDPSKLEERTLFWRFRDQKAVRRKQWKLLINESDTTLYDLHQDLNERNDISNRHQDKVRNLVEEFEEWEKKIGQNQMKTF
ncbi:sulfatase-like hydrolase/transferase [Echinicola soli]|uniref:Sulfatase-like hydrolase/transferase n=1 Tax=Echinicola soli TaxID=2591634 RepID=A0A514CND8_9BACT|nr:sulfatase-like hydrolase/transferase [Echinicola soli]QDH81300.1 sulfatase-like hydrolase/transferase [Echinicola soli]